MKKELIACLLMLTLCVNAQDSIPPLIKDTSWKSAGFIGINASQTALSDWQGGGNNNVALGFIVNLEVKYQRDKFEQWINKLDAQFGTVKQGDKEGFRKTL